MTDYHDIYDRIAKRCLSLSARSTVSLINGLYGTDYTPESKVTYHWTEHTDDSLHRTLADTIVTINDTHSYHLEFQMTLDGDIVFRVLEYSFHHAFQVNTGIEELCFPEPMIIYLYDNEQFPDEYSLKINFGKQGSFLYKVPVFKYLQKSQEELNQRKLIVLIPFQLLRLRRAIEKERTSENMTALKNLISHDILQTLDRNVEAGNITQTDAVRLGRMILYLYHHIYGKYGELAEEGVTQMAEEALIFDVDILEHRIQILERDKKNLERDKKNLEEKRRNLEESNRDLEESKRDLEEKKRDLEESKRDLEEKKRDLEEKKRDLEENVKDLALQTQIWKLTARGLGPEAIAEQLSITCAEVLSVLQNE